jgi:hypothetical protein
VLSVAGAVVASIAPEVASVAVLTGSARSAVRPHAEADTTATIAIKIAARFILPSPA